MNSSELLNAFRDELYDQKPKDPLLWSDAEVFGYMDDAQKMFCRLTEGIGDGSSALTKLSIAPIVTTIPPVSPATDPTVVITAVSDWVAISPLILKFRDAYRSTDARPVQIINYEDLPTHGIRFNGRMADKPEALVIGIEPGRARIYPAPTVASLDFIQLIVDRLPLKTINDEDLKLEIAEQHHINLLMWMKHRAYAKQDADTYDAKKSNDFRAEFEEYCRMSKHEKDRAKSKVRIVQYGGIGGANSGTRYHNGYGRGSCRY